MDIPLWLVGLGMPLLLVITLAVGLPVAFSLSFVATFAIPEMLNHGYSKRLSAGSICFITIPFLGFKPAIHENYLRRLCL